LCLLDLSIYNGFKSLYMRLLNSCEINFSFKEYFKGLRIGLYLLYLDEFSNFAD